MDFVIGLLKLFCYGSMDWRGLTAIETFEWQRDEKERERLHEEEYQYGMSQRTKPFWDM